MKRTLYRSYTTIQLIIGGLLLVVLTGILTFGVIQYINSRDSSIIPRSILQHVDFQIYAPISNGQPWTVPKNTVSFNSSTGILTITATSSANSLSMNEQQTPEVFTNIPQYYPTLLNKLNEYDQIQTILGTVGLTHPTELHGQQTAILNSSGTLVFVRPKHNLNMSAWTSFFNNLIVVH